ncbi:MAG: hypothetical protein ACLSVF_07795, partial [Faecalibacterium sp.]
KHPSLPLARAERKPLDQKRKHPPRHQRENLLKENQALLQQCSALRRRRIRPLDENISRRKIDSP